MIQQVTIKIAGEMVPAEPGVSLASVIHSRRKNFRNSPILETPRGLYCGMGVCFECVVTVNGQSARACITPVSEGMIVELQP